jgi:glucosamine--fructose-6-phosphate aminotransferase (isomerizing)
MSEIKARNGKILTITNSISPELSKLSDKIINVPLVKEELEPIVNIIPLQLLSYYLAVERGLDPDKPRNLAKSVTVE